jgi:putative endonuclease
MIVSDRHHYYVYITTNTTKNVLYTGVTNNLYRRIIEHYLKRGTNDCFTGRYYCYWLVYYEEFQYINDAIAREKEIKGWSRKKKEVLIVKLNPSWTFLNKQICRQWPPSKEIEVRFGNSNSKKYGVDKNQLH